MQCRPLLQRCCGACLKAKTISADFLLREYGIPFSKLQGMRHYKEVILPPGR